MLHIFISIENKLFSEFNAYPSLLFCTVYLILRPFFAQQLARFSPYWSKTFSAYQIGKMRVSYCQPYILDSYNFHRQVFFFLPFFISKIWIDYSDQHLGW